MANGQIYNLKVYQIMSSPILGWLFSTIPPSTVDKETIFGQN
jgi:hypothetical protein